MSLGWVAIREIILDQYIDINIKVITNTCGNIGGVDTWYSIETQASCHTTHIKWSDLTKIGKMVVLKKSKQYQDTYPGKSTPHQRINYWETQSIEKHWCKPACKNPHSNYPSRLIN